MKFGKSFWVFGGLYGAVALAGIILGLSVYPLLGFVAYALSTLIFFILALCLGKEDCHPSSPNGEKAQRLWGVLAFSIILGILLIL